MEITIFSLNEKNINEFIEFFKRNVDKTKSLLLDFTYLYNMDIKGFEYLIQLIKEFNDNKIECILMGTNNYVLKHYTNENQLSYFFKT